MYRCIKSPAPFSFSPSGLPDKSSNQNFLELGSNYCKKNKAIGLLLAGKEVAKSFKVTTRSVKRWWRKEKHGESQEDMPKNLTSVAKIVIAKSMAKKRQTTRKLDFLLRIVCVVRTLFTGIWPKILLLGPTGGQLFQSCRLWTFLNDSNSVKKTIKNGTTRVGKM